MTDLTEWPVANVSLERLSISRMANGWSCELRKPEHAPTAPGFPGEALIRAVENAAAFAHVTVLELLVAHGVGLNGRVGEYQTTPLHKAAAANQAQAIEWLLAHGADPTLKDAVHQGMPADWARHFEADDALRVLTEWETARSQANF